MVIVKTGNIFTSQCQTIVNTVNCVGFMGAGIAFEFKLRYPKMFSIYQRLCEKQQLDIGLLWIYTDQGKDGYGSKVLNFPTKKHWKEPSKLSYISEGLEKFIATYKQKNIESIAFPLLGASLGGLSKKDVLPLMQYYLNQVDIPVEIWEYDACAKDDLFDDFKAEFLSTDIRLLAQATGIRLNIINAIKIAMTDDEINTISGLLRIKGVGETSVEKVFSYLHRECKSQIINESLSLF